MVRGALRALLAMESDIEVVAEVARADEVVSAAMACRPDVALMDIEMPGGDGITSAAALHEPAALPQSHPDDLRQTRLPAPGDGNWSVRLPAQGRAARAARARHPAHGTGRARRRSGPGGVCA